MVLVPSRAGRWLAPATQFIAVFFLLANTLLWLSPAGAEFMARHLSALATEPLSLTPAALWMGWGISTVQLGILAVGLWAMAQVFRLFARGEHLHPKVGGYLRRFGIALLVTGIGGVLFRAMMAVVVTMFNPPGERLLLINLSSNDVVITLVGVLIMMLGYALKEAAAIAEDNRQIV